MRLSGNGRSNLEVGGATGMSGDALVRPDGDDALSTPAPPWAHAGAGGSSWPRATGAGVSAILNERDFVERAATTQHECDASYRLGMLQEVAQSGRTSGAHAGSARPVLGRSPARGISGSSRPSHGAF